ncbi:acyltransferase family protein [Microlunatus speluncae]|uniref:acyltransferase family protein n=1 Tax=Microlunatus speluncae TaxID=2594267 RepID=UPI001375FEA2|nr:acyltransferase [Microlunatus speluncae]
MVDLVRAGCLIIVVGLHAFMAGITVDAGQLSVSDATHGQPWFAALTWLVQIMPLFFLVGGFASITHWRRLRSRGASPSDYLRARLERLARPAVITFAVIAAGFGLAMLLGVSGELLAQVGFRMGQPMWFLGVYLGVTALVPIMVRLHESAPKRTLAVLAGGAVVVDVLRFGTGIEAVGFLNLVFVWLAVQQLGFGYADGWFRRIDRRQLPAAVIGSLLVLIMVVGYAGYSPNLIDNLNPPTCCLLLLGVVQGLLLTLAAPALERLTHRPTIRTLVDAINDRAMTIYLWHMSVLVTIALIILAAGLPFPEPLSAGWWFTRGFWLLAIAVGMIIAARALGRFERGRPTPGGRTNRPTHPAHPLRQAQDGPSTGSGNETSRRGRLGALPIMIAAVLLAIVAVGTVLIAGFSLLSAALATLGLAVALRLARGTRPRRMITAAA